MTLRISGDQLDEESVVARYVGGSHVDLNTGVINGSAFDRNHKDLDGLSFTECGVLSDDVSVDHKLIREVVGSRIKLGKKACFAQIAVGDALDTLDQFEVDFSFVADPLTAEQSALANPAHCLMLGLPFVGEVVASLRSELAGDLLRRVISGRFPAVS